MFHDVKGILERRHKEMREASLKIKIAPVVVELARKEAINSKKGL